MKGYCLLVNAIWLVFLLCSCKKEKVKPIDKLPPATQEGKNTFGCLVNGEAWMPKGNNGTRNLYISYDPGRGNGGFTLATYRILSDSNREYFTLYTSNINTQREFVYNNPNTTVTFLKGICSYDIDKDVYRKGTLTITKFDLPNQIIAGTFEAILAKPGCDTVKITDGRFDMKF